MLKNGVLYILLYWPKDCNMKKSEKKDLLGFFSYQVCYLDKDTNIEEIAKYRLSEVLRIECFPTSKRMQNHDEIESCVKKYLDVLFEDAKNIMKEHEAFYAHFDIDFSRYETFYSAEGNKIISFGVRPGIKRND